MGISSAPSPVSTINEGRVSHWIRPNHQCRIPKRWIAFDTESRVSIDGKTETQTWRIGAAVRWRHGLKTGDKKESATFDTPLELWQWVTDYCVKGYRTAICAHNLSHDVRIADVFRILPTLGWRLEWMNLDRSVSAMTWRSNRGTLVFWDTWTWLPIALGSIGYDVGSRKLPMPRDNASRLSWERYCLRDCEISYLVTKELVTWLSQNDCGNWQPTGAGMAYATWRHKFLTHSVLVHDDPDALEAERSAMYTGRAEAWRHGKLTGELWTEVDMRNAYTRIAAECDLPCKLKFRTGALNARDYSSLTNIYRVLAYIRISADTPSLPYRARDHTLWPEGTWEGWYWDTEVQQAISDGAQVTVLATFVYTRKPLLAEWGKWVLGILHDPASEVSPIVRTWAKHCARALIGRISLRVPSWELYGGNPEGLTGITWQTTFPEGKTERLMHVGDRTFVETGRVEGRDSLPAVTGWIMAECRVRLWRAMRVAGLSEIAHTDTDSLIVSRPGLRKLRDAYGAGFGAGWQVKGTWRRMIIYGPRQYRAGTTRKASGVPIKADEIAPNTFKGERWRGLSAELATGSPNTVTVMTHEWSVIPSDPRRRDTPGVAGRTSSYTVDDISPIGSLSSSTAGVGA